MKRISARLQEKARPIMLLLLDVDGVLTDGRIIIDDRGVETKEFDVRDGLGIALLRRAGIEVGLITSRSSNAVSQRAKELGIRLVYQGVQDKADAYRQIKQTTALKDDQIAYAGDDIVDLPILRLCGLAVTVRDGRPELRSHVDYVTAASGGRAAVREIAELLLKAQDRWDDLLASY